MNLRDLQRHWDRFARQDPLWAVLTDPHRRRGRWSPEEIFAHGEAEVAAALSHARGLGLAVGFARALDFGCGVGRLTQALAARFDECEGVDIAPSMVALAQRYNRFPGRCRYHVSATGDLRLFEDGCFTFAYSTLVLQHMQPQYSRAYIRELLRVLAPGGLLSFQVPGRELSEPAGWLPWAPARELPDTAFHARLVPGEDSLTLSTGEIRDLHVRVENVSTQMWPRGQGDYAIYLGNHWLGSEGQILVVDDARSPLPADLPPGAALEIVLKLRAPDEPGQYTLELDLVQESVAWFQSMGSPTTRVAARVAGASILSDPRRPRPRPGRIPAPLRRRLPGLHRFLVATRVLPLTRRGRRALAGLRSSAHRKWDAVMEMHCVPRDEVLDVIRQAGGRILEVEPHALPGFESFRYWVTR